MYKNRIKHIKLEYIVPTLDNKMILQEMLSHIEESKPYIMCKRLKIEKNKRGEIQSNIEHKQDCDLSLDIDIATDINGANENYVAHTTEQDSNNREGYDVPISCDIMNAARVVNGTNTNCESSLNEEGCDHQRNTEISISCNPILEDTNDLSRIYEDCTNEQVRNIENYTPLDGNNMENNTPLDDLLDISEIPFIFENNQNNNVHEQNYNYEESIGITFSYDKCIYNFVLEI